MSIGFIHTFHYSLTLDLTSKQYLLFNFRVCLHHIIWLHLVYFESDSSVTVSKSHTDSLCSCQSHAVEMPRVGLCKGTGPRFFPCWYHCVSVCECVSQCVSVKPQRRRKSISNVMRMQIVFLVSTCAANHHHNTPPPFNLSQNGPQSTRT